MIRSIPHGGQIANIKKTKRVRVKGDFVIYFKLKEKYGQVIASLGPNPH
jgi:hypothetical protein